MNSFDLFGNPEGRRTLPNSDPGNRLSYSEDITPMGEEIEDGSTPKRRFLGIGIVLGASISILALQAYHLQVSNAGINRSLAEGNSVRLLTVPSDRGLIVDANGEILAQNSRKLALAINPQTLPTRKKDRETVYALLKEKAELTDEDITYIEEFRSKSPEPFAVKTNLTKDESLLYREWFSDTQGVILQELPVRRYIDIPSLGHLIGYMGRPDQQAVDSGVSPNTRVGRAGLEKQYNDILSGKPGVQHAEVNASGEVVRLVPDSANSEPKTGDTLKLSIDAKLQKVVSDALIHELERRKKKFGDLPKLGASAVVIEPQTGAIKAMVSLPDYGASLFAEGIAKDEYQKLLDNPANPLLNRAMQGTYAPGSTIKPFVASAGLQTGIIKQDTSFYTPAAITIGSFSFPDWKLHGQTNTRQAIAESNNIFFYALGGGWEERNMKGLGIDRLAEYYQKFGFGAKTGIDIPGEASGLVPTPAWKKEVIKDNWYIGDTYQASIGQGFVLATPLQLASATASIANGGTLWKPTLAWSHVDPVTNEEIPFPRTPLAQGFVDPAHLQVV
ncbi:MAG: penicillin-binding transpeptidase domain-containing protein, partial [Candidatus Paceibacterota bacterium]